MNWIDGYWSQRVNDPVLMGTFFVLSIMLIASFIDLPFSIYRNFVLEQKFGFNRMTVGTFAGDLIKEVLLSLVLVLPLIYAILYLMNIESIGNYWPPIVAY